MQYLPLRTLIFIETILENHRHKKKAALLTNSVSFNQ